MLLSQISGERKVLVIITIHVLYSICVDSELNIDFISIDLISYLLEDIQELKRRLHCKEVELLERLKIKEGKYSFSYFDNDY